MLAGYANFVKSMFKDEHMMSLWSQKFQYGNIWQKQNKNIPLFYHIPRCGGTYIIPLICELYRVYIRSLTKNPYGLRVGYIDIMKNNKICFRIMGSHRKVFKDSQYLYLDYEKIEILNRLNIFAAVVEPHGFVLHNEFIEKFNSLNFKSFIPLREPYDKMKSLYFYLNNDKSKHEDTHGLFGKLSFENYLSSHHVEDSWLIRNILNLPDNAEITEKDYHDTIKILENFIVYPFQDIQKTIDKIFLECWGVTTSQIDSETLKSLDRFKNESAKNNIKLSDLSDDARNKFLSRSYWSYKLYNHYMDKIN